MPGRFKLFVTCFVLSISLGTNTLIAQMLRDSNSSNLIKKNIDCIYNLQFEDAHEIYIKIKKTYPSHPALFLLSGLSTYWQNYPLLYTNSAHISFEEDLRQCIRLSEKNKNKAFEAEYLLTNLCARGMLLKFYDDNNHILEVIPLVTSTYKYLRHSFDLADACKDLNYYTGAYNFYREAYPEVYPVYKPLALLLPSGNKEKGLKELHYAAINSIVLRAESYFFLATIYLNFENKYEKSIIYCKTLHVMYPDNVAYLALYLKNLMLLKRYDETEKLINAYKNETGNEFSQAQLLVFEGLLYEKKYHDYNHALELYHSGISKISTFGQYGNECIAYAYFGMSRISYINSDKVAGKKLHQKAMSLGNFKKINFDE